MLRISVPALLSVVLLSATGCFDLSSREEGGERLVKSKEQLLIEATRADDAERIVALLGEGLDLGQPRGGVEEGRTLGADALTIAGTSGSPRAARVLLDAGVSPNASDVQGKGGLSEAAGHGNYATLQVIVEAGADLSTAQAAWAARSAATNGRLDMLQLLVEYGLDVNFQPDPELWTPLLGAAFRGHTEIVRYLLEQGADPDQETLRHNKDGTTDVLTPRGVAQENGRSEILALFENVARRS